MRLDQPGSESDNVIKELRTLLWGQLVDDEYEPTYLV